MCVCFRWQESTILKIIMNGKSSDMEELGKEEDEEGQQQSRQQGAK